MKQIQLLFIALITCNLLVAQGVAPLPTAWDFSSPIMPVGYSEMGTDFYTSAGTTCNMAPSLKLNFFDEYVQVHAADQMGVISFTLRGTGAGDGTVEVQESPDGMIWTNLESYIGFSTSACEPKVTPEPLADSRYMRIIMTDKVSGSNASVDNLTIGLPTPTAAPEINILESNSNPIYSGAIVSVSADVAATEMVLFTVENLGTTADLVLDLTNSTFSDAVQYAFDASMPGTLTIPAATSAELKINFTPPAQGTYESILTLMNNDGNESPYLINFFGVGGGLATEPLAQATALTLTEKSSFRFVPTLTYPAGNADGYIILRNSKDNQADAPTDGEVYTVGEQIGDSKVVAVGLDAYHFPTGIIGATNYTHLVYAYNGFDTLTNYLLTDPVIETVTTVGAYTGAYYDAIDETAATFPDDLTANIYTMGIQFYGNYDELMINRFYSTDTIGGQRTITCQYSNRKLLYNNPFDWTTEDYSREHSLPHSWMPSFPSENQDYADYHALFPVDGEVNSSRSNFVLNIPTTIFNTFDEANQGGLNGSTVFEPKDGIKGDVARAMFYMIARYNNTDGDKWGFNHLSQGQSNIKQNQNILRQWHFDDPVDKLEIARNDFVDSLQGNRNPFIDHPEWVCYIDFDEYVAIPTPGTAACLVSGLAEQKALQAAVSLFPNPVADQLTVEMSHEFRGDLTLEVMDVTGRLLQSTIVNKNNTLLIKTVDVAHLNTGFYILNIRMDGQTFAKKFVVE